MKKEITILLLSFLTFATHAQEGYIQSITQEQNYQDLKNFLSTQKFNNKLFRKQFEEWFSISKKNQPAAAILVNSSHVIQSMPVNYGAKDLFWISPSKRFSYRDSYEYENSSFGNQLVQDIMYDVGGNILKNIGRKKYRYHYSAAENNRPYQRPAFLQF